MFINTIKKKIKHHQQQVKNGGIKIFCKKIINVSTVTINIPFYFLAFFFLLILKLLKPIILIRIGRFRSIKLGHLSEEYEIFLCEKKLNINQPNQKYIDLFFREKYICNEYYYHLRKKEFVIFPRIILLPLYQLIIFLGYKKIFICDRAHAAIDTFYVLDKTESTIKISDDLKKKSNKILEQKGLNKNQKIICLHLRDDTYRGKNNATDFRNIKNIDRYIKTIEYLTKKGYFVIRTGVRTKKRINFKDQNYFDYSQSEIRTEKMDVFLASSCHFCIANGSGFEPMVRSFRKPVLYTNFNKYGGYKSQHQKDMTIFLHYVDIESKKKIGLKEIFDRGLIYLNWDYEILEKKIYVEENSEDEILEATIEMIDRLDNKWQISNEVKDLAIKFNNFYNRNVRLGDGFNAHTNIKSQIPNSFLKRNKHLL